MKDWFKNIFCFDIREDSKVYSEKEISSLIDSGIIRGFSAGQLEQIGFGKVVGDDYFFPVSDKCFLFSLQVDKKDIPKKIVDNMVKEANKQFIADFGKPMSKNELIICKEDIIDTLLPKAFIKSSNIMGYIDYENMVVVVDASSPNKFDLFSSKLREMLPDLNFEIINPDVDVSVLMGSWISNYAVSPSNAEVDISDTFHIGESCILKQVVDDGVATISVSNKLLDDQDVRNHLDNGAIVESLALNWEDKISFSLNSNFRITKVKSTELINDIVDETLGEYDASELGNDEGLYKEYKRVSYGLMVKSFSDIQKSIQMLFSK